MTALVHGDHELELIREAWFQDLSTKFFLRCGNCGCQHSSSVSDAMLRAGSPGFEDSHVRLILMSFKKRVPAACSEAKDLAAVSHVMES